MMAPRHTIAVYMHAVECREDAEVVVGGRAASEHTTGALTCAAVKFPQANHGKIGPNSVTHQRTVYSQSTLRRYMAAFLDFAYLTW